MAAAADPKAANPFESVLRALTLEVPGLVFEPQVTVTSNPVSLTPDLVDRERRIALEADSFSWHGSRGALRRDCRRYNALVLLGWWVLRFTWEDVMHDPEYVRDCLAVLVVPERAELPEGGVGPA
ncbi:MAG: endonuclease domain-containing protein [Nocardioidaceae bacterium]